MTDLQDAIEATMNANRGATASSVTTVHIANEKLANSHLTNDTEPLLIPKSVLVDHAGAAMSTVITKAASKLVTSGDDTESLNDNNVNNHKNLMMCRICHCEEVSHEFLISPCYCSGTLKYVHQACLQQWLKSNGMTIILIIYECIMHSHTNPRNATFSGFIPKSQVRKMCVSSIIFTSKLSRFFYEFSWFKKKLFSSNYLVLKIDYCDRLSKIYLKGNFKRHCQTKFLPNPNF